MRLFVCFVLAALSAFGATDVTTRNAINQMPLRFEARSGQAWVARGMGFGVGVNRNGAVFGLGQELLELQFVGGDANADFQGEQKSATPNNYFDRNGARSADTFLRLRRAQVYPGIDVVYYGQGQSLEYDFDLAPGADPSQIRMRFSGARAVHLNQDGALVLTLSTGEVIQKAPVTYQRKASGEVISVASRYMPENDGSYSLQLGAYDASRALTVDPQLLFTAYLAGTGADGPVSMSKDKNGTMYLVGYTSSRDFPLVGTAYSGFLETSNPHIYTTKVNALAASADDVITYSGFFGGQFGDTVRDAVVNANGVLYLTGITDDFFFPTTSNAYATSNGETRKMFVARLDTNIPYKDSLTYSTFFGGTGTEEPTGIAIGPNEQVYITGFTSGDDYPVKNFLQEKRAANIDGFVAQFDLTKSGADSLVASTYLGASFNDVPQDIAVDANGKVYITGYTNSYDFTTTGNGFQPVYQGGRDAFLLRLDLAGKNIEYGTFLGGSGIDYAYRMVVEAPGRVALAGFTLSDNFPVTSGAVQTVNRGNGDGFLTILDTNKSSQLAYSTFYGGSDGDVFYELRRGPTGYYYLGGYTLSRDLRTVDALRPASALGSTDGLVVIIDANATADRALIYASYVTGPGFQIVQNLETDNAGNVYVVGQSLGNIFDPGQAAPPADSSTNVFMFVFRPSAPAVVRQDAASGTSDSRSRR